VSRRVGALLSARKVANCSAPDAGHRLGIVRHLAFLLPLLAEELQESDGGQVIEQALGLRGASGGDLDAERFLDRADDEAGGDGGGVGPGAGLR
jgi:hypothetical protein